MNKDITRLRARKNRLKASVLRPQAEKETNSIKKELLMVRAEILENTRVEELNTSTLIITDKTSNKKKPIYYTDDYPIEVCVVKIFAYPTTKGKFYVGIDTPTLDGRPTQAERYYPMNLEQAVQAAECLLKREAVPPKTQKNSE